MDGHGALKGRISIDSNPSSVLVSWISYHMLVSHTIRCLILFELAVIVNDKAVAAKVVVRKWYSIMGWWNWNRADGRTTSSRYTNGSSKSSHEVSPTSYFDNCKWVLTSEWSISVGCKFSSRVWQGSEIWRSIHYSIGDEPVKRRGSRCSGFFIHQFKIRYPRGISSIWKAHSLKVNWCVFTWTNYMSALDAQYSECYYKYKFLIHFD